MLEIKKAVPSDLGEIIKLIRFVHDNMENPNWYVIDDESYYMHYLKEEKGFSYIAVDTKNDVVAGFFMSLIPDEKELNLGYDMGMTDVECNRLAVMETAAVLPGYRGKNLQYRMMQMAEQDLRKAGYAYLAATVHPDNRFSLNNMLKQGYEIMETKEKYGGFLRHILLKRI